jgi:DNA-binding XRE family transcriptional regulator
LPARPKRCVGGKRKRKGKPPKNQKNVGSNFILVRSGLFFIFCLLDFILFAIIILKELSTTNTLLYYQIIENMANERINIGENIKKRRTKQGLSQEDFAKKSGVKYTTLTKIKSNVIKKPSVLIMAKIAKALGVNIEDLIK